MLNKQYYVEKAKVEKTDRKKKIRKQIFIMEFMTVMNIRY